MSVDVGLVPIDIGKVNRKAGTLQWLPFAYVNPGERLGLCLRLNLNVKSRT